MDYEFELPGVVVVEDEEKIETQVFLNKNKKAMLFLIYIYKYQPITHREIFSLLDGNINISKKTIDLLGQRLENKGMVHRVTHKEAFDAILSQKGGIYSKIVDKHKAALKKLKGYAKNNIKETIYYISTEKGKEWLPFCLEKLNIGYKIQNETKK